MVIKNKSSKLKLINYVKAIDLNNINEIYLSEGIVTLKPKGNETEYASLDCKDCIVTPGFIDPQINGLDDCDFWQFPKFEKIDELRLKLALSGTVAFCPTIITEEKEKVIKLIEHLNEYLKQAKSETGAKILGIHLEGLFITKYGVHKSNYVLNELTIENIEPFIKDNVIIFTLAPELDKSGEVIKFLQKKNILVSIGHSNASYSEGELVIKKHGLNCVTHMFNALKGIDGFSHRSSNTSNINILELKLKNENTIKPEVDGIALSILKNKNVLCMVIPDGVHINKEVIDFLYRLKGKEYFALVTDMVSRDFFDLAKSQGNLGGGQSTLEKCVSNLSEWGICNIEDALICASRPISNKLKIAKEMGLGQLSFEKKANITLWDTKKNRGKGTIIGENIFLNY